MTSLGGHSLPQVNPPSNLHDAAVAAYRAGMNVLAPRQDGSKAPLSPNGSWTAYQTRRSTVEELRRWYGKGSSITGLGIVTGSISGNVELFEFDDLAAYGHYLAAARASGLDHLVERVASGYEDETPGGGIHWLYRCPEVAGNTKLARRPKRPEEMLGPGDRVKVLIETRGQGGFAVCAPSYGKVHPTGRPYILRRGGFGNISTVTPEERRALWDLARTLDQMPKPSPAPRSAPRPGARPAGLRAGDDYNARGSWPELLQRHGWKFAGERAGVAYWTRPGKAEGVSATTNYQNSDLLYVFTSSTEFEAEQGYSKFHALALLEYQGDFRAAADALSAQGHGTRGAVAAWCKRVTDWEVRL